MNNRSSKVPSTTLVWVCMVLFLVERSLANPLLARSSSSELSAEEKASLNIMDERRHHHNQHHLAKRSFFDIQCKGVYDKSIFARLDRICEDCYNLFREPQVHSLCRKNCFTTDYFKGCLDTLQLSDELEQIQTWIKQLHGADPGV